MTFKEWSKKYYPIEASKLVHSNWKTAIYHSIRKWKGIAAIYKLNIDQKEHNIIFENQDKFSVDSSTCALCQKGEAKFTCFSCPIFKITKSDCSLEYSAFIEDQNPYPMLKLLKKVYRKWNKRYHTHIKRKRKETSNIMNSIL